MDKNRYIAVQYKLYTGAGVNETLVEETTADMPFTFLSGFGLALKAFEAAVIGLDKGATYDFIIKKDEAYGEHDPSRILDLERSTFEINGRFDSENVYVDAILPLQDEEGTHYFGRVLSINDNSVTMDMNHPLAGKDLHFKGFIQENREATDAEVEDMVRRMSSGRCHCGGSCGGDDCSCSGDCGSDCGGDCGGGCNGCGE